MDSILNKNVESVKVLSAKANKGTIESLYTQLEMGKLCSQGYDYWKANKKKLGIDRDGLCELYGYKKTFFGDLRRASTTKIEDVEKYIESLKGQPTASISDLLKFLKDTPLKAPNKCNLSRPKTEDEKGISASLDSEGKLKTKSELSEVLAVLEDMTRIVKAELLQQLADIELTELIEA